jgi:hypothetical protein
MGSEEWAGIGIPVFRCAPYGLRMLRRRFAEPFQAPAIGAHKVDRAETVLWRSARWLPTEAAQAPQVAWSGVPPPALTSDLRVAPTAVPFNARKAER